MFQLSEVIQSLPPDVQSKVARRSHFARRLAGSSGLPPSGTFQRAWTLGGLQATLAAAYLSYWIRSWFRDAEQKKKALMEVRLDSALRLLEGMGYLRGAVMKVGQLLSSYPEIVPHEFILVLQNLHLQAPPMHYSMLREYLRAELGAFPEELFESFEPEALASASIGQVHRARLKTGEEVAVKIQYPGISQAIRADFKALLPLLLPQRLGPDWESLKTQLDDLKNTLIAETDYEREAKNLKMARSLFRPEDGIVIPQVYEALSTSRVLTMEYLEGDTLQGFLQKKPDQDSRNAYAEKMLRAVHRMIFRTRMLYGDPSVGNVIFMTGGRLGLVDFGCMRLYSDAEWEIYTPLIRSILRNDWSGCVASMSRFFAEDSMSKSEEYERLMQRITHWNCDPIRLEGEFDYSRIEYVKEGIENLLTMVRSRFTRGAACNLLATRAYYSVSAIHYQLGAKVNVRAMFVEEARRAGHV